MRRRILRFLLFEAVLYLVYIVGQLKNPELLESIKTALPFTLALDTLWIIPVVLTLISLPYAFIYWGIEKIGGQKAVIIAVLASLIWGVFSSYAFYQLTVSELIDGSSLVIDLEVAPDEFQCVNGAKMLWEHEETLVITGTLASGQGTCRLSGTIHQTLVTWLPSELDIAAVVKLAIWILSFGLQGIFTVSALMSLVFHKDNQQEDNIIEE